MNHFLKRTLAVGLIVLGIIGLALPFLQGVALICAGLFLFDSKWTRQVITKLRSKLQFKKKSS